MSEVAEVPLEPALFILFGTTGDLARKKLYPALYALHTAVHLAPQTARDPSAA